MQSPIFQHAIRVSVTAAAATLAGRLISPNHAPWVSITAIAVLQPYLGPTLERVVERVVGTILGAVVAIGLIAGLHTPIAMALAMFPLAIVAVVTRPRSYRLFVLFLTPVFLMVADQWQPTWETALVRIGDVVLGGAIAVAAAIVAPSRERARLPEAIAAALEALERYVAGALEVLARGGDRARLEAMRREVGVALEAAEVSLERMLAEPRAFRRDTAGAVFVLTHARRISAALTALSETRAARGAPECLPPSDDVRNYVIAVLEATKRFIATGDRARAGRVRSGPRSIASPRRAARHRLAPGRGLSLLHRCQG